MFNDWCEIEKRDHGKKQLCGLREKPDGREAIRAELIDRVRSHYDKLERIAEDVDWLGFPYASAILKERMPRTARARSGEIGEIIATEFVEFHTGFRVPVRRLRYKDGREMALRGDDFLGVKEDNKKRLFLLKGESKSGKVVSKAVVRRARKKLSADDGRPTPISLVFVADQLLESADEGDRSLGRRIRNEVAIKAMRARRITHGLFALSGKSATAVLGADLRAADGVHGHISISLRVNDHGDFVREIFEEAGNLGDN